MTIAELQKRIEERGFTVAAITSNGDQHVLDVRGKDGSKVNWPTIQTGKSGQVNSVMIKSYHPPKITGQNEHATVAVYGDLYMQHNGRPSAADKAVAAALAPKQEAAQQEQAPAVAPAVVEATKAPEPEHKQVKKSRQAA